MGGKKKLNENGLTEKEQRVFEFIVESKENIGYSPSVRDVCVHIGLKSTSSVHGYLVSLESKGWIRRDPTKPRTLVILRSNNSPSRKEKRIAYCEIIHAPIIGDVAAGVPILAEQNIDGYCPLPVEEYGGKDVYMLRVRGDSMINIGIYDGDKVIVEPRDTAEDGDIVVALVEDSATVKRFFKEKGRYRLQPENDAMQPMYFDHIRVQGKVVGLLRRM